MPQFETRDSVPSGSALDKIMDIRLLANVRLRVAHRISLRRKAGAVPAVSGCNPYPPLINANLLLPLGRVISAGSGAIE